VDDVPIGNTSEGLKGSSSITHTDLIGILDELSDYVCVHSVELDRFGDVSDARLEAWNRAYEDVRTKPVDPKQSIRETYFQPELALDFVNRAWHEGVVKQVFELSPATRDRYRTDGAVVYINVLWQRIGEFVVEVGTDLNEVRLRQMQLADEESAAAAAVRARIVAEERERIASDLHDSVIQQLFASSLVLTTVASQSPSIPCSSAARLVASVISDVITEIRRGIIEVRSELPSTLEQELIDAIELIASTSGVRFVVRVAHDLVCEGEIRSNVRTVVRESVTNAVRHGHAATIHVEVTRCGNDVVACITDDGVGLPEGTKQTGGLGNLRRRAERLGGGMSIVDGDNGGTVLSWQVPLPIGSEQ
jgi:hypothetical protein